MVNIFELIGQIVFAYAIVVWIIVIPIITRQMTTKSWSCRHYDSQDKPIHGQHEALWRQMTFKQWLLGIGTLPFYSLYTVPTTMYEWNRVRRYRIRKAKYKAENPSTNDDY